MLKETRNQTKISNLSPMTIKKLSFDEELKVLKG